MITYCRRDTEITGKFVKSMMKTYNQIGCNLKTTIAATTLDFFETKFYQKVTHNFTEEQIDWFHTGYYGGRTEIFFNKPVTGNIYYHDLNSLYPYCLKTGQFPKLDEFYETKKPNFNNEGIAEVEIQAPKKLPIPYLPCRHENKLIFPLGNFRGVYTFFELREAQKLGYKMGTVYRAIEFPSVFNPFENFIETIYAERLKAQKNKDELMSQVYKAFGNFAYGKYAQKNETTELVPTIQLKTIPDGTIILGGELALVRRIKDYPRYANCVWAMYTTSYARHRLYHKGLIPIEKAGGLLLYCDTDSVIYENKRNLISHSKELGEFKLEGEFRYAHFKLPKLYHLIPKQRNQRHIYKSKGVPSKSSKTFFKTGKARFKRPNKLRETLRRNLSPKRVYDLKPNYWETREKEIRGKYTKRIVLKSGHTKPVTLKLEDIKNDKIQSRQKVKR